MRHSELKKRDQLQQQQQQQHTQQQQKQLTQEGHQTDSQMEAEGEEEEESERGLECPKPQERNDIFVSGSEREMNESDKTAKETL